MSKDGRGGGTIVFTGTSMLYCRVKDEWNIVTYTNSYVWAQGGFAMSLGDDNNWIANAVKEGYGGHNENGQLGDGTMQSKIYPVKIMNDIKFIAPGPYAIKNDGSLWTWGASSDSDEEKKVEGSELLPKKIMDNVIFASKFDGGQSVAIREDGSFWIWGKNNMGQLGDGTTIDRSEPVKIMDDSVCATGNTFSTIVLKKDGSLWHMGLYNDAHDSPKYLPHKVMDNIMLPEAITFDD